ncbi:glycine cleavage T C-terminal barrel domain-containing protein [Streptomyces zingiberis]|uniref:Aminomethyl transferase family protein n=1 Tax=Streptomyces zingiberis TaxID=2053010 RepID=A0ABX1BWB7_9ACTN|nr:glycine cleavage T C-terminal barrel domain-containing protein [Streptomyces zingiberis]NJQ00037.1 aminomethyl transferase family protein [Streptomyces zingiberis]
MPHESGEWTDPNFPSVDQSDRTVPVNLRQTGRPDIKLLISTRARKSPYWHLAIEAGCRRAEVYNRMYLPRGYGPPEGGGSAAEYEALTSRVTLWDIAAARQIQVQGREATEFVNYVVTRDVTRLASMRAAYVVLCDPSGRMVNDPLLLKISPDEYWFSISDSDLSLWLKGVNVGKGFDVRIQEIDVSPVQIQGAEANGLMTDLIGDVATEMPAFGLLEAELAGLPVLVSRTGFSGEAGFEVYLKNSSLYAERMWDAILRAGEKYGLTVTGPIQPHRITSGIIAWGQDVDNEMVPFQVGLAAHIPRNKASDYIGRDALEQMRAEISAGHHPYKLTMVGLRMEGEPIADYLSDFWLVAPSPDAEPVGFVTSASYAPKLQTNVGLARLPVELAVPGTQVYVFAPAGDSTSRSIPAVVSAFPIE